MLKVKIITIGNSTGIRLPKAALTKLKATKGDSLYLVENKDGFTLTPYKADFDSQMIAAEKSMSKFRNTLRKLAK
ncbi:MAG: AbrB/MazE/SpoVT family DNA-binding domain-containing protein [Kangiellaceae bacterium]|nr:AbrB/MazE/SpoVT family DNA-binding domain-containing protein [Kangiellaceae bacterium]